MILSGALLLALSSWAVSLLIESPREAVAKASAPDPSLLTVPVEMRKVGQEIVTRGTVNATQTVEAVAQAVPASGTRALISGRVPSTGDEVKSGTTVVEVSGRPVIALQGNVPPYRTLEPGDSGPDVTQLREGLALSGLRTSDDDATYGTSTQAAVAKLYKRAGYSSPADGGLPSSEILFVSALPASIVSVSASLGAEASDSSIKVATGELVVRAQIPPGQIELLEAGANVVLSAETLNESVGGKVDALSATQPSAATDNNEETRRSDETDDSVGSQTPQQSESEAPTPPVAGGDTQITITPDEKLPGKWAGLDVRVRVVSAETSGEVLAVPTTAIFMDGTGSTQIAVITSPDSKSAVDARAIRIDVNIGVVGGGWAQITPKTGEPEVQPGTLVQLSESPSEIDSEGTK